jgi:hypothetical protein
MPSWLPSGCQWIQYHSHSCFALMAAWKLPGHCCTSRQILQNSAHENFWYWLCFKTLIWRRLTAVLDRGALSSCEYPPQAAGTFSWCSYKGTMRHAQGTTLTLMASGRRATYSEIELSHPPGSSCPRECSESSFLNNHHTRTVDEGSQWVPHLLWAQMWI